MPRPKPRRMTALPTNRSREGFHASRRGVGVSLQRGDAGEEVFDLQRRLAQIGYRIDDEQHRFEAATDAALRRFQQERGLVVDGICGPQAWLALVEAAHRLGDRLLYYRAPMIRGDDVADLQRRLGRLGFDARWIDGIFGPNTQVAVEHFQRNVGLAADGMVGPLTVQALNRLGQRPAGELTIAQVKEHERLRSQPSSITNRRVIIGDTGELQVVGQALSRRLRTVGADVLSLSTPNLSHQALTSNQWSGDMYLGISLVSDNYAVSYFAMGGFRSTGGQTLAIRCSQALSLLLDTPLAPVGMRLPILRETRMPAVWCRIGPGAVVVPRAPGIARALAHAVLDWFRDPVPGIAITEARTGSGPANDELS